MWNLPLDTSHLLLICMHAGILSNTMWRLALLAISLSQFTFHVFPAATTVCIRSCPYVPSVSHRFSDKAMLCDTSIRSYEVLSGWAGKLVLEPSRKFSLLTIHQVAMEVFGSLAGDNSQLTCCMFRKHFCFCSAPKLHSLCMLTKSLWEQFWCKHSWTE